MKPSIYLDHAAATPVDPEVLAAMLPYFSHKFHNPSATYLAAKAVRADIEAARAQVAHVLGTRPAEIIFTAGGTEANNLAILGVAQQFPGSHIVSTALEHDSVRFPMQSLASKGWKYTEVAPQPDGIVDPKDIQNAVTENTVLVSIMYANNEIGTVQPIREIARIVQEIKQKRQKSGNKLPLYLHTDSCQAANYLDIHINRLGVDLMTLNGGKIYGPKQSGMLYVSSKVELSPLVYGGGQERGMRSGTENVAGIIGFAAALEQAQALRHTEVERLKKLQSQFLSLIQEKLESAVVNGSRKHRLPNNIHITIPGQDNERLLFGLDEVGIEAAAGSACSASSEEVSHVLSAIGLSDKDAQSSLRFSMGRMTTEADIKRTVSELTKLVA